MKKRKQHFHQLAQAVAEIRQEAKAKGLSNLSMREINNIVAEARRDNDPLYGQTHQIKVTLSERMFRQLKVVAHSDAEGSMSAVVRQAIGDYLTDNPIPKRSLRNHCRRRE